MSANDGKILNYLVRMVIPMRREFGRELDVQHFLHDFSYARSVLAEALTSQDARLRQYAEYVDTLLLGPRVGAPAPAQAPAATPPPPAPPTPASVPPLTTQDPSAPDARSLSPEEELKARILKKYTNGLR